MRGHTPHTRRRAVAAAALVAALALASIPGDDLPDRAPTPDAGELPEAAAAPSVPVEAGAESLAGRVEDPHGAPVAAASVRARRELAGDPERPAEVAADGSFSLSGLPRGRWLVRAAAPGFSGAATVVDVPSREPITLTIAPVARIAGRVFDLDGAPAAADVVLAGSGVWPARTVRADDDGHFVLEDVPPGVYEVQVRGEEASAPPRRGLVVEAGGRAFLTFHFEPGETLIARVLDAESEQPIANAEVVVMEDSLGVAPRALRTGADGSLRVAGLRAQAHRVTVHAEGYVPVVAEEWTPGAPLRVALEPGATLSGVVVDGRNRPIEGATLEVVGDATNHQPIALAGASVAFREQVFEAHAAAAPASFGALEVTSEVPPIPIDGPVEIAEIATPAPATGTARLPSGYVTGADGSFRITGVPPGHVQVLARANGHAPGSSERVWVAPAGERDDVRIVLAPAGRIEGVVRDEHGDAVSNVVIEHRSDGDPFPRTAYTDAEGAFTLEDVAGAITLRALPLDRAPVQVRVDVAPGGTVEARIDLPSPGPTIAVRTLDERGHAVARAQVRLESMAPGALPPRVAFSDEDGRVAIDDAPPGPWRLVADHPDYAQGAPVDLDAAPPERTPLALVLREGVLVRGSVIDPMLGEGIEGAEITLETESVPPVTRSVRTDGAGSFVIPRASPGAYVATIASAGRATRTQRIEIAPSRYGEVELAPIELAAGATLEGDVVDALGAVVRGAEVGIADDPATSVRTDAHGHFALSGLGEGSWVIRIAHPAVGEVSRTIQVRASREPAPIVVRLPGRYDPDRAPSERALRHGVAAEVTEDGDGIAVASVAPGSRAMRAGLRAGDRLLAIDGEEIATLDDAEALMRGADGIDAVLDLARDGEPFRLRVPREAW